MTVRSLYKVVTALVVTVSIALTGVTPARADTFSNDDPALIQQQAAAIMTRVKNQAAANGIDPNVFSNDTVPTSPVQPAVDLGNNLRNIRDDSYSWDGKYVGYRGNVSSPALMNDSEAGRYFRRRNTGASINPNLCQESLFNKLGIQKRPSPTVATETPVGTVLNSEGLDAILTAVKQAHEPYYSAWAKEELEALKNSNPNDNSPFHENKSRASQRYNRQLMLQNMAGRDPETQAKYRQAVEEAEKNYWMDQISQNAPAGSIWVPLTIAILSGDQARVRSVISALPAATRQEVAAAIQGFDPNEIVFLLETGIILVQDLLILIKFVVEFTVILVVLIIAAMFSGGSSSLKANKLFGPTIDALSQTLEIAEVAIIDILRLSGRLMVSTQKYWVIWQNSSILPSPADFATALDPYTPEGRDFYCLLPNDLNQSRTIVTSGYAVSQFMKQLATIDMVPMAIQMQKTADSLTNMHRYSKKVRGKGATEMKRMVSGDAGGSVSQGSVPNGSVPSVPSGAIPGQRGATFTNVSDPVPSLSPAIKAQLSSFLASPDKLPGVSTGTTQLVSTVKPIPVGNFNALPSLSSVLPGFIPQGTALPPLRSTPSTAWAPVQAAGLADTAWLIPQAVLEKTLQTAGIVTVNIPTLIGRAMETVPKVLLAGHQSGTNNLYSAGSTIGQGYNSGQASQEEMDARELAFFYVDLSRTLYDTLDLFMITRSFLFPFVTSFLNMAFTIAILSSPGGNDLPVIGKVLNLLTPAMSVAVAPLASIVNSPEFVTAIARSPLVTSGPTVTRLLVNMATRADILGDVMMDAAFPEDAQRAYQRDYFGNDTDDEMGTGTPPVVAAVKANENGSTYGTAPGMPQGTGQQFSNDGLPPTAAQTLPNGVTFSN